MSFSHREIYLSNLFKPMTNEELNPTQCKHTHRVWVEIFCLCTFVVPFWLNVNQQGRVPLAAPMSRKVLHQQSGTHHLLCATKAWGNFRSTVSDDPQLEEIANWDESWKREEKSGCPTLKHLATRWFNNTNVGQWSSALNLTQKPPFLIGHYKSFRWNYAFMSHSWLMWKSFYFD